MPNGSSMRHVYRTQRPESLPREVSVVRISLPTLSEVNMYLRRKALDETTSDGHICQCLYAKVTIRSVELCQCKRSIQPAWIVS